MLSEVDLTFTNQTHISAYLTRQSSCHLTTATAYDTSGCFWRKSLAQENLHKKTCTNYLQKFCIKHLQVEQWKLQVKSGISWVIHYCVVNENLTRSITSPESDWPITAHRSWKKTSRNKTHSISEITPLQVKTCASVYATCEVTFRSDTGLRCGVGATEKDQHCEIELNQHRWFKFKNNRESLQSRAPQWRNDILTSIISSSWRSTVIRWLCIHLLIRRRRLWRKLYLWLGRWRSAW